MAAVQLEDSTLKELMALLNAVKDSATPGLAERITGMLTTLGVVAAEIEPEPAKTLVGAAMDSADSLADVLRDLDQWKRSGTWNALKDLVSLSTAIRDSATPALAERFTSLAVGLGQIAGEAGSGVAETVSAAEANGSELAGMVRQLGTWHKDGTWDAILEGAGLLRALKDSVSPQITERVVSFASDAVIDLREALDSGLLGMGIRATEVLHEAVASAERDTSRVSLTALMRALKEPEIQYSVKVLMAFVRRLSSVVSEE